MYHIQLRTHTCWSKKGEMYCTNIPKIRAMCIQVGKHAQSMCPSPYVTSKYVPKPMSYVAALHLVPN